MSKKSRIIDLYLHINNQNTLKIFITQNTMLKISLISTKYSLHYQKSQILLSNSHIPWKANPKSQTFWISITPNHSKQQDIEKIQKIRRDLDLHYHQIHFQKISKRTLTTFLILRSKISVSRAGNLINIVFVVGSFIWSFSWILLSNFFILLLLKRREKTDSMVENSSEIYSAYCLTK